MAIEVDDSAVNDRIAQAERLILPVASRLHARLGRGESLDDLCSMGRPAALEAARKWDGRGSFPAFTAQRIKWAILDGVRREQRSRPPRDRRFAIELAMVASVERAADAMLRVEDREEGLGMKRSTVFGLYWRAVERLRKLFEPAEPAPG